MIINLEHKFARLCNCKKTLLEGVNTLSQFMKKLEKEAKTQHFLYKDENVFKGDALIDDPTKDEFWDKDPFSRFQK